MTTSPHATDIAACEPQQIFITGASGLIGTAIRAALQAAGHTVFGCDLRATNAQEKHDFRDAAKLQAALAQCDGVVHLAAVSRVIWGETHPELCRAINTDGTQTLLEAMARHNPNAWLVSASSREIYGTPAKLPCTPDTPHAPENLYARTKHAGEKAVLRARENGARVAIVRFSNVFGSTDDYPDRVAPAFAAAAARGDTLHVYGGDALLDFTPLADAVSALARVIAAVANGAADLPPIDIVTGRATSLLQLAQMAVANGSGDIVCEEPRAFYPAQFQGDPSPAKALLGWTPQIHLEDAMRDFVQRYKTRQSADQQANIPDPLWLDAVPA